MSRFNLIDEAWIPVRLRNGTHSELSLREVLLRAKAITAIEDASPLVVAALHRFLLAVLYRALHGPTDIRQAQELFQSGLPAEKIEHYLKKFRNRFWLFDDRQPFGQIPTFEPKTWRAWTVLAAENNADNAKVLFDHVAIETPGSISAAEGARRLLATQAFSVSCGKSELSHTGTAPSATAVIVIPLGTNLQETLLFCLVPQNRAVIADDLPLWERDPESITTLMNGSKRAAGGLADRYTWRSRSIRFIPDENDRIEKLAFASGVGIDSPMQIDPMLGYRIDEKNGRLPIQFRERGLWRNFDSLLPDGSDLAPQVIEHAVRLTRTKPERLPRSVLVLGQANDKAKIEYWRMERFALPGALAGDRSIRNEIHQLLEDAADAQEGLWAACRSFARAILSRGDRDPASRDITAFVEQMATSSTYWSGLESHFHEILREYRLDRDSDDIRLQWLRAVRDTLRMSWTQHRSSVAMSDAWAIRALAKAEVHIERKLRQLNDEISQLEPVREES